MRREIVLIGHGSTVLHNDVPLQLLSPSPVTSHYSLITDQSSNQQDTLSSPSHPPPHQQRVVMHRPQAHDYDRPPPPTLPPTNTWAYVAMVVIHRLNSGLPQTKHQVPKEVGTIHGAAGFSDVPSCRLVSLR